MKWMKWIVVLMVSIAPVLLVLRIATVARGQGENDYAPYTVRFIKDVVGAKNPQFTWTPRMMMNFVTGEHRSHCSLNGMSGFIR